jgi:hypothetical protein
MSITDTDTPPILSQAAIIDLSVAGIKSSGMLLSDMPDQLDGQEGRSVTILSPEGVTLTYRIFVFHNHILFVVTGFKSNATGSQMTDLARFNQSFHLVAN